MEVPYRHVAVRSLPSWSDVGLVCTHSAYQLRLWTPARMSSRDEIASRKADGVHSIARPAGELLYEPSRHGGRRRTHAASDPDPPASTAALLASQTCTRPSPEWRTGSI